MRVRQPPSVGGASKQQKSPSNRKPDEIGGRVNVTFALLPIVSLPTVNYTKEKPPIFRGKLDTFAACALGFVEYAKTDYFFPVFGSQVELNTEDPYSTREKSESGIPFVLE